MAKPLGLKPVLHLVSFSSILSLALKAFRPCLSARTKEKFTKSWDEKSLPECKVTRIYSK